MTHIRHCTGLAPFILFATTLSLGAAIPLAAQAETLDPVDNVMYPGLPPPPPVAAQNPTAAPLAAPQTDIPEPEVNIRKEPTQTIEEFRSHGRPYMIKVTPKGGLPPYYMVDNDGDGTLETRVNSPSNPPPTPRWVLFRW